MKEAENAKANQQGRQHAGTDAKEIEKLAKKVSSTTSEAERAGILGVF